MDEDVASAATQLFGAGPSGLLVIDARELLTSTARVVGAQLGELHFKVWMALVTLHVAHGLPAEGRSEATAAELSRMIWGDDRGRGGWNTRTLLRVLFDLFEAKFTVPGLTRLAAASGSGEAVSDWLARRFWIPAVRARRNASRSAARAVRSGGERLARSNASKSQAGFDAREIRRFVMRPGSAEPPLPYIHGRAVAQS